MASDAIDLTDVTNEQGYFLFENLPAGNYTITVEDSNISQTITLTGQNKVTLTLTLPIPAGGWQVELERGPGLPLLVGDIGVANEPIMVTNPKGFQTQITSGSKLEWGTGGFEIYAPETGNYVVQFLGQSFTIPMDGQFTRAIFRKSEGGPDEQVRIVSTLLPRSKAEAILQTELEADPDTKGLFEIQGSGT